MEVDALTTVLIAAITLFLAYIQFNKSEPDVHPLVLQQQSTPTLIRNEGESVIYRSKFISHTAPLLKLPNESRINTLYDVWQAGRAIDPSAVSLTFLLQNQFYLVNNTYEQAERRISGFGSGFVSLTGLKPKTETPVGIMAPYSQESFIAQQAFYRYSFVAVPIHDLKNIDLLIEVVSQTKLKAIIVSQKALPSLLHVLKECPSVKTIIVAGIYISAEQIKLATHYGVKITKFSSLEYNGSLDPLEPIKPAPDDIAMINFNTKSNSLSKGVVLTHSNLVAAMAAFSASLPAGKKFTSKDRLLSHFSHGDVIAIWLSSAIILTGGSQIFPSGLMKNVLHEAQASMPTIFASAPITLEKIHQALQLTYGKGFLFNRAYAAKLALLRAGRITTTSLWDFVKLTEIRGKLGGKVRMMVTTNPTQQETLDYIRAALGIHVISTYGRTETSGLTCCSNIYDYSSAPTLGGPVGCNEIKLIDYVEGGYTSSDAPYPRGEILIRGPNVMKGYYKKPNATASVLDKDGWFHTSELGAFHDNGAIELLGKKKRTRVSSLSTTDSSLSSGSGQ